MCLLRTYKCKNNAISQKADESSEFTRLISQYLLHLTNTCMLFVTYIDILFDNLKSVER